MTWQEVAARALPDGAVVRSSAHLHLEPQPRNVSQARRFVQEEAGEMAEETRETLLLLTSELVTNAIVHARTEVELAITTTDHDMVVTVHDLDLGRSEQRSHDRDGGRGLTLVRALAQDCGQERHLVGGKTSWFRLARTRSRTSGHGEAR